MKFSRLFASLALLLAGVVPGTAAVYPVPQQVERGVESVQVKTVEVLHRSLLSEGGMWDRLPETEGAYALQVSKDGTLRVYVQDAAGEFYAKQTLCQMLEGVPGADAAHADPFPADDITALVKRGMLPVGTVVDWADVPLRGVVEGYYGIPWSMESRRSVFRFMGRNKMNYYLYAPKDDPYHHGEGCYELYPEDKAQALADLVRCAKENHVRFVWAIHPSNTVRWQEDGGRVQLEGLCAKLQAMYELGVRDFGVLVDDTTGEIGKVERQVQLCNYLLEHFILTHPDVRQELIMCPTGYCKAWTPESFLRRLGGGLDRRIRVIWTGDRVVSDISRSSQDWVNRLVGRPTFIWWNRPCNDMKASRLQMGRIYGLEQCGDMGSRYSGFMANPMEHAEASKVGLMGVADYTWNINGFESEKSWRVGMKRLYPQMQDAFSCFCEHNSRLLAWDDGPTREESVSLTDIGPRFRESLAAVAPDEQAAKSLIREFARVEKSGAELKRAEGDYAALLKAELEPWMDSFERLGRAGRVLTEAVLGQRPCVEALLDAQEDVRVMEHAARKVWRDGKVDTMEDVQVGSAELSPAMEAARRYVHGMAWRELTGAPMRAHLPAFADRNGVSLQGSDAVAGDSEETCWHAAAPQQEGDTITLDFGAETAIRSVQLQMGCIHERKSAPEEGVLEISPDGRLWLPVEKPTAESCLMREWEHPFCVRFLRYRITKPGALPLTVRHFAINGYMAAQMETDIPGLTELHAYEDAHGIGMGRIFEAVQVPAGAYVQMSPALPVKACGFRLAVEDADLADWARIEMVLEDGSVATPRYRMLRPECLVVDAEEMPQQRIRCVRLVNAGQTQRSLLFYTFLLQLPKERQAHSALLTDGDLTTGCDCGKEETTVELPRTEGKHHLLLVGTAKAVVEGAEEAAPLSARVRRYTLPAEGSTVKVTIPCQPGKRVEELILVP